MDSVIYVLNIIALISFGLAVNTAAFAVRKYLKANTLHRRQKGREYGGALPRHIWKTALGSALTLIGGVYFIAHFFEEFTVGHGLLLVGFVTLLAGMRELLSFEEHRIDSLTGEVRDEERV